jgi:hypothetical protein
MYRFQLARRGTSMFVRQKVSLAEGLRVSHVGVQGQQQRGAFLNNADARVLVPVNAALMAFGLSKPAFQIEIVLRQVRRLAADEQAGLEAGHDLGEVLLDGIVAALIAVP